MKKLFTKISLLCIGLMLCAGNAWATPTQIEGTELYWEKEANVLTFTGSGAIPDYDNDWNEPPYKEYAPTWGLNLILPDGLTRIGDYAFNGVTTYSSTITIPSGVISIGDYAFKGCASLTTITIENESSVVTVDGEYIFTAQYENEFPSTVEHIYVPEDLVDDYKAADYWKDYASIISAKAEVPASPYLGEIFTDNDIKYQITYLLDAGYGKLCKGKVLANTTEITPGYSMSVYTGDMVIPSFVSYAGAVVTIVDIDAEAFANAYYLTSIELPSALQTIGARAFQNCMYLSTVTFTGNTNLSIGEDAFATGYAGGTKIIVSFDDAGSEYTGTRLAALASTGCLNDVTIARPAQMEHYNTICLPFALNAEQITASNLADAEIYKFSNAAKDGDYLDLHFQPVTAMEAGVPYFFRFPTSGDNLSSLTFEGVTVTTTTPQDVTHNGVTLHGTLSQVSVSGSNKLYLAANDELHYSSSERNINPFRAYFEVAGLAPNNAPKARIVAHENAATGIEDVAAESKAVKFVENGQILIKRGEAVYNLQGQVVK